MAEQPGLLERMVRLQRARQEYRDSIDRADKIGEQVGIVQSAAEPYIEMLEDEARRVGVLDE